MTSVQRYLDQTRNHVAAATLTASSVRAVAAVRTLSATRAGSGRVRLVGDYTGHETSDIDVEILDGGATARASAPAYAGVGNGTLTVLDVAAGATAQTLTYTLADLGTATASARLPVDDIEIVAAASGASGNSIRISSVPDLTETATAWSLIEDWPASQAYQAGEQWSFGALPLRPDGTLDPASQRIRFGADPEVYRPYREYHEGAWRVGLSPALARDVAAGTRVWSISGGYDVTVTDGVTTETYPDVVSFYELCVALADSALVTVSGVVAADRAPGGMAAVDVPLRTTAWILASSGVELAGLSASANAPTETVTVACVNADAVGREVWQVKGAVSGDLGQATTGEAFTSAALNFTVPAPDASLVGVGRFSWTTDLAARDAEDAGAPSLGLVDVTLGVNAKPGTYTFTYTRRPDDTGCDYATAPLSGRITPARLGLEGDDTMDIPATIVARVQAMHAWRAAFAAANTEVMRLSDNDLDYADELVGLFQAAAVEVAASPTALAAWDTAYAEMVSAMEDLEGFTASPQTTTTTTVSPPEISNASLDVGDMFSYSQVVYRIDGVVTEPTGKTPTRTGATPLEPIRADLVDTGLITGFLWSVWDEANDDYYVVTLEVTRLGLSLVTSTSTTSDTLDVGNLSVAGLIRRYTASMDHVRSLAGILPNPNQASSGSRDGCWQDDPDATHHWVESSGELFPAFTNTAYHSARQSCGTGASVGIPVGKPYCSKEFGFFIAAGCDARLKEGDKITLVIAGIDGVLPYSVGDEARVDIVAAGPAYLFGGITGDDTLTWRVSGSVDGALPDYALTAAEPSYDQAGAEVRIQRGGIPHALGDTYTLEIAAARFRWRRDGGAWSAPGDIEAGDIALADGLSARFTPGSAPSWLAGDAWHFRAEQPHAPSHLRTPDPSAWRWTGASANLVAALGATRTLAALAVHVEDWPTGATLTLEGGDGATWPKSQTLTVTEGLAVAILSAPWNVSHLRLSITGAPGAAVVWLWAGAPFATTYHADTLTLSREWAVTRGEGWRQSSLYAGAARAGRIAWSRNLTQADADALLAILDAMQAHDWPMILVPHHLHPQDARRVRVAMESVEIEDEFEYQPDNRDRRMLSGSFDLRAAW